MEYWNGPYSFRNGGEDIIVYSSVASNPKFELPDSLPNLFLHPEEKLYPCETASLTIILPFLLIHRILSP